jgi:hypothetical protein
MDGNMDRLILLKLLQNDETEGRFFNSGGRAFHASGIVESGNLRR